MKCDNFVKLGKKHSGLKNYKKNITVLGTLPNSTLGKKLWSWEARKLWSWYDGMASIPRDLDPVSVLNLEDNWLWLDPEFVQNEGFEICGGAIEGYIRVEWDYGNETLTSEVVCSRCKETVFDWMPIHIEECPPSSDFRRISTLDWNMNKWVATVIETLTLKQLIEISEKMK